MKPETKYDDPGLHLTPFGRRALLIGIIIGLAIAIAWALTSTAGAASEYPPPQTAITLPTFAATSTQLLSAVCQKGVVTDFLDAHGGHVVFVVRSGKAFADSYFTIRHYRKTQRVTVCAGVVS